MTPRLDKERFGKVRRGTLSPGPPEIYRMGAYRKDDERKDDNHAVIVLPYKPPGAALRLRPRRALSSGRAPQRLRKTRQQVKRMPISTLNQDSCAKLNLAAQWSDKRVHLLLGKAVHGVTAS